MRNLTAAALYPAVCLLEATNVSVGRGTDQPFERFGAPWIDGPRLSAALNAANLPGVRFIADRVHTNGKQVQSRALRRRATPPARPHALQPVRTGVTLAWTLHALFPEQFQLDKVERLLQNAQALQAIKSANDPAQIERAWKSDLEQFQLLRRKYLIYK